MTDHDFSADAAHNSCTGTSAGLTAPWPKCCECDDFNCMDAYVLLSPEEVKAFHAEVSALNSKAKHPDDYRPYLLHLEGVLRKASAEGLALFFAGHD